MPCESVNAPAGGFEALCVTHALRLAEAMETYLSPNKHVRLNVGLASEFRFAIARFHDSGPCERVSIWHSPGQEQRPPQWRGTNVLTALRRGSQGSWTIEFAEGGEWHAGFALTREPLDLAALVQGAC